MRNSSSGNLRKTKYEVGGRWSFVTNDGKNGSPRKRLGCHFLHFENEKHTITLEKISRLWYHNTVKNELFKG